MIVADAGPLMALARMGRLELLHQVVTTLVIPEAVYAELVVQGRGKPGAAEVARSPWIRRVSVHDREAVGHLPPTLGVGEREAIVLAGEHGATLLMDDARARDVAEARGITVVGVLWVLSEAKRRGDVPAVRPLLDALLAVGYRLHPERVIRPFLEAVGEASPADHG